MTAPTCTPLRLALCAALLACGALYAGTRAKAVGSQEPQDNAPAPSDDSLAEANMLHLRVLGFMNEGKYREAEPLAVRSLELLRKRLGSKNLMVMPAINRLGLVYMAKGDFARAKPLFEEALAVCEELRAEGAPPVIHTSLSQSLNNLAILNRYEGNFPRAEQLLLRALGISESTSGIESADAALAHANLSALYDEMGNFAQAEKSARSALAIRRKLFGEESVPVAGALSSLGMIRRDAGDYVGAETLLREALAMREKLQGKEHLHVAHAAVTLASLYSTRGDYVRAEDEYMRALNIFRSVHGSDDNVDVASVFGSLVALYVHRGDHDPVTEERILLRVLAIHRKVLGPEHPDVAISLANLATLSSEKGDMARAEQLYKRALAIREKALGQEHPFIATLLSNMALLAQSMGDAAQALSLQSRANDIRERNLESILSTGAENQKLSYLAVLASETDGTVSLHVDFAPQDARAARLALTTVLRRKGRVLDAMSDQIGALRRRLGQASGALLDRLAQARSRLSTLVLKGSSPSVPSDYRTEIAEAESQVRELEAEVSQRSVEFRTQTQPVTLEHVQASIPRSGALVELVAYRPFNLRAKTRAERWGAPRYVAYVLKSEGPPAWVALEGGAASLNDDVTRLRAALRNPRRGDARELARALDERLMRPIRKLLGDARQVLLSPDGALNLLPFAALVDEQGQYLVERYAFTYLTSGRDLLRLQTHLPNRQEPVVMANPTFDLPPENQAMRPGKPSDDSGSPFAAEFGEKFDALSATTAEATEVGRLLGVKPLLETRATEAALKNVHAPKVLHVATHGFFRSNKPPRPLDTTSEEQSGDFARFVIRGEGESPLLRSGLALAGANNLDGGAGEDGVLTAFEASGLDLWGTELVVLSACETGLGDVRSGEGVYGLRRSLVLAGAESQVISLWKVNDEVTKSFMIEYHERLKAAEGRAEALRNVQLGMLKTKGQTEDRSHPYYWASFLESGGWGSLDGQMPARR